MVVGTDGELGDCQTVRRDAEEFDHFARDFRGVGDEVLEANDERVDLARSEPVTPGSVVRDGFARDYVDLFAVIPWSCIWVRLIPVVPVTGLDRFRPRNGLGCDVVAPDHTNRGFGKWRASTT